MGDREGKGRRHDCIDGRSAIANHIGADSRGNFTLGRDNALLCTDGDRAAADGNGRDGAERNDDDGADPVHKALGRGLYARSRLWNVSDRIDLDQKPFARQARHLDGGPRRPMVAEHALIHAIHVLKPSHVDQEHAAPQHVLQIRTRRFKDCLHVPEALFRLPFDGIAGELSRRRIGGGLTGDEDQAFESHAGRVRTDGLRQVVGVHGSMRHEVSSLVQVFALVSTGRAGSADHSLHDPA